MGWGSLPQTERTRIANRTNTILKRILDKGYTGLRGGYRGLLAYGSRLEHLIVFLEEEFPESKEIWVYGFDSEKVYERGTAFKLFSHIQYLVVPQDIDALVLSRLRKLCEQVRIKFATFFMDDNDKPRFILEEGGKGDPPDPVAVREFLKNLKEPKKRR